MYEYIAQLFKKEADRRTHAQYTQRTQRTLLHVLQTN